MVTKHKIDFVCHDVLGGKKLGDSISYLTLEVVVLIISSLFFMVFAIIYNLRRSLFEGKSQSDLIMLMKKVKRRLIRYSLISVLLICLGVISIFLSKLIISYYCFRVALFFLILLLSYVLLYLKLRKKISRI